MSKFHGAKAGYEAGKQFLGKLFGKKQKTTGTEVIKSVKPFVPKTNLEKAQRDLRRAKRQRKTSEVNLDNTLFRIKQEAKKLKEGRVYSGKELEQQKYFNDMNKKKKAKGGRIGYSKGTPRRKTDVEKIKKTFSTKKGLGMQSIIYGLDKNPDVTKADPKAKFIAAAMKKKKKKKVI